MTENQKMLWDRMLKLVEDFYEGQVPFHTLVYQLDDAMELAGFQDAGLVSRWRDRWDPLYEVDMGLDFCNQCVDFEKVNPLLQGFAAFLLQVRLEAGHGGIPKAG